MRSELYFKRITLGGVLRMACKGARVEAGRPVRMLLQMSRQEMMGTWTRGEVVRFWMYFEDRADRVF